MEKVYSEERAWQAASTRPRAVSSAMQRLASRFSTGVARHERACWEGATIEDRPMVEAEKARFTVGPLELAAIDELRETFAKATKVQMQAYCQMIGVPVTSRVRKDRMVELAIRHSSARAEAAIKDAWARVTGDPDASPFGTVTSITSPV